MPRAVFDAPVTVACQGVFPWALSLDAAYDKRISARLLYRDLAFGAEDVLRVWPGGGSGM